MRIRSLEINDFKSIRRLSLPTIPDLVVIAGPNGSGKSALFDAIRIFKESIAGYSYENPGNSNVQQILSQVGPTITVGQNLARIAATIVVNAAERTLIELPIGHNDILRGEVVIQRHVGGHSEYATTLGYDDHVYLKRLFGERFIGEGPVGVLDHIGPDRRFSRYGQVHSISFSTYFQESELRKLVVDSDDKFSTLSEDLVMMRILDLLERDQGVPHPHRYIDGIRKIFQHFLPDKEFVDVDIPLNLGRPSQIIVRSNEVQHDISLLSSGQREILMTYTHLEKLRPTGSIILFDEPELHLHPALQRRVIEHLRRIIEGGDNQIWIITHAEEIVDTAEFASLFAMTGTGDPAVVAVEDRSARLQLLQNLGANLGLQLTSPRILFLEGDSDIALLPLFFEQLPSGVSLVDTSGKNNLMRLTPTALTILEEVINDGQLYFVRDRDIEDDPAALDALEQKYRGHFFAWKRYHIENYLLEEDAIYHLLASDPDLPTPPSVDAVRDQLRALADERRDNVLAKIIEARINPTIRRRLRVNLAEGVKTSLLKNAAERQQQVAASLNGAALEALYDEIEAELNAKWNTDWKSLCIGRDVLKAYHNKHIRFYLGYEVFRNRIARTLRERGQIPSEIQAVFQELVRGLPPALQT